jgi:hypothetical protein
MLNYTPKATNNLNMNAQSNKAQVYVHLCSVRA